MLRFLKIRHLAVIDAVELEFEPGLNVLTGETGAGKSILVQAVGLLLGGRASADLVRTGEEMATIEAIFDREGSEVLVRREVTAQGRSRAFIDGSLATAGALQALADDLIELHGQHEHQTLLDPASHMAVLDAFGSLENQQAATADAFEALRVARESLEHARDAAASRSSRLELVGFQVGELDRAAVQADEDVALQATRQVLANAERIERLCGESYAALYEEDGAVLAQLGAVWRRVGELAGLDPVFQPYLAAREDIKASLEDLASFLRRYADGIEVSPARLQQVEDRLAVLDRLKRKYGPTLADLLGRHAALRQELESLEGADTQVSALEAQVSERRDRFLAVAGELSTARREAAGRLGVSLERLLGELAMERTRVEFRFNADPMPEAAWSAHGLDRAEFFVSPNVGEDLRPLARIVSGGELSRIMLAIKTLTATTRRRFSVEPNREPSRAPSPSGPGLIFDEVDAGIGGRVADVVGRELRTLASAFQVLCITHLPQIAAYADTHFRIEKGVMDGRTRTSVTRLDHDGRVEELARMLGGAGVTAGIRASAAELLATRRGEAKHERRKAKAKVCPPST